MATTTSIFTFPEQAALWELVNQGRIVARSVKFAQDIALTKNPSSNQMFWVRKLIDEALVEGVSPSAQGAASLSPSAHIVDMTNIIKMFDNAKQHLKKPKITLQLPNGRNVRFNWPAVGRSVMWLTVGAFGTGTYGTIDTRTGALVLKDLGRRVEKDLLKLITDFSLEPRKMAILHGRLTGICCFCCLPLKDAVSLKMGYGPICAGHYKLPYGHNNQYTAMGDWMNLP